MSCRHGWPRRLLLIALCAALLAALAACDGDPSGPDAAPPTEAVSDYAPTPDTDALRVSSEPVAGERLRVTLPSITLLKRAADVDVQLFLVLADDQGSYAYLLVPANQSGAATDSFDLSRHPLELGVSEQTGAVTLWVLALHNRRYESAEAFGVDALASSLAIGFRNWLRAGDEQDDPLAAVVSASDGALFEWFAGIDVLGEGLVTYETGGAWPSGMSSLHTPDGGMNVVYVVQHLEDGTAASSPPRPTPAFPDEPQPGYTLAVDETFAGGTSAANWYEGSDSTYVNRIVDGAYEIELRSIEDRDFARSWGSIEDREFSDAVIQAQVTLLDDAQAAEYGIWFRYQDDFNFVYVGLSNAGEYRVAVVERNRNARDLQPWTPLPAVHPGAATNIIAIRTRANGDFSVAINGTPAGTFHDDTFTGGSVAFFCSAESVPATCHLERLRIWESPAQAAAE